MNKLFIAIAIILVFAGIIVSFLFFKELSLEYWIFGSGEVLMDKTGQVGDFIGGVVGTIFSLSGFIMLLITLKMQASSDHLQKFEMIFFEMVRFHRDNIQELEFDIYEHVGTTTLEKVNYTKRKVFRAVFTHFISCRNELQTFLNKTSLADIYQPGHLKKIEEIKTYRKGTFDLRKLAGLDMAWCITFFGLSNEGEQTLRRLFRSRYNDDLVNFLLSYVKLKPKREHSSYNRWKIISATKPFLKKVALIEHAYSNGNRYISGFSIPQTWSYQTGLEDVSALAPYPKGFKKFYGGHQFRLGHYFRHLYQSVKFVDRQKNLSFASKYDYVKILRAQLSVYEQAILVMNSLSSLGLVWDFAPDYEESRWYDRRKERELISNYNLIKNLPNDTLYGINIMEYYPKVNFEIV